MQEVVEKESRKIGWRLTVLDTQIDSLEYLNKIWAENEKNAMGCYFIGR